MGVTEGARSSRQAGWLLIPSLTYAAAYGAFALVYTLGFGAKLSQIAMPGLALAAAAGLAMAAFLTFRAVCCGAKFDRADIAALGFAVAAPVLVQLALGVLPFNLSDAWGHVTMVNRMVIDDSTVLVGAHVAGAPYAQTYTPHHAFFAAICQLTGAKPLAIWQAFSFPFSTALILAYYGFLRSCLPEAASRVWASALLLLTFALVYPVCVTIRGSADYRIANCILFFSSAQIAWPLSGRLPRAEAAARVAGLAAISALMAASHLIEPMLLLMTFGPFLALRSLLERSPTILLSALAWAVATIAAMAWVKWRFYSGLPAPLQMDTSYGEYAAFHFRQLQTHITWPLWAASIPASLLVLAAFPRVGQLCLCGLAASVALSALNPVISRLLIETVSTNLVWRIMFAFWPMLVAPLAVVAAVKLASRLDRPWARHAIAVGAFGAFCAVAAPRVISGWGLDGRFSYAGSDRESQLRLWPDLYRYLGARSGELVVSDMLTSEPIAAVTRNNVLVHRTWATAPEVFAKGQAILAAPDDVQACRLLKETGATMVLVNRATLPAALQRTVDAFPLARDGFYAANARFDRSAYLSRVGVLDDVTIYVVKADLAC
jgi:hypothetical protein